MQKGGNAGVSFVIMTATNGSEKWTQIDTGKWCGRCRSAVSIREHRGGLSVEKNLINTEVKFIRHLFCTYSRYN